MATPINMRIQQKHDIEANWLLATNFVPLDGELIVYDVDTEHSFVRFKVGNGVDNVSALPFSIEKRIVDVEALPASGASINDIYRVLQGTFVTSRALQHSSTCYVVEWDKVPSTAGESFLIQDAHGDIAYVGYYNIKDNNIYGYINDTSKNVLKALVDSSDLSDILKGLAKAAISAQSTGWSTAQDIFSKVGSYTSTTYGGIITSLNDATNDDAVYLYLNSALYRYLNGKWVSEVSGVGFHGTGNGSEIFNSASNVASGNASHAEGCDTTASDYATHAEGAGTVAGAEASHAEGRNNEIKAGATAAHVEGANNTVEASAVTGHAEGQGNTVKGMYAHAEGGGNVAQGIYSHTEGGNNQAIGPYVHAEGANNIVSGEVAHAEGNNNNVSGYYAHAEGINNEIKAGAMAAHVEGEGNIASGVHQHVQGRYNEENADMAFILGNGTDDNNRSNAVMIDWNGNAGITGDMHIGGDTHVDGAVHAVGAEFTEDITVNGKKVLVEGDAVTEVSAENISGVLSVAQGGTGVSEFPHYSILMHRKPSDPMVGISVGASGAFYAEAPLTTPKFGTLPIAQGGTGATTPQEAFNKLAAEGGTVNGNLTITGDMSIGGKMLGVYITAGQLPGTPLGNHATAEGYDTTASGGNAHAEGFMATASGDNSHAEGNGSIASANGAHAEGCGTSATSNSTHAEGELTEANGWGSHAEGGITKANGVYSHTEGAYTIASGWVQHVQGQYNVEDSSYLHIVGNGKAEDARSNAHTLDWDGNAWYQGAIKIGGTSYDDEDAKTIATEDFVTDSIDKAKEELINNPSIKNIVAPANSGIKVTISEDKTTATLELDSETEILFDCGGAPI